jgi:low affinity Fe/Cu permease
MATLAGHPGTFGVAVVCLVVWAASGPFLDYSTSWQLIVNTCTTICTFLMVFLIQNTQNRDALAFQIKLSELVIAMKGAPNSIASIEDLSDEDLEKLQQECHKHATDTAARAKHIKSALAKRRSGKKKKKS